MKRILLILFTLIILVGCSDREEYLIQFKTAIDSFSSEEKVFQGDILDMPEDPVKEGYVFLGWYTDEAFITVYDFDLPVYTDFTLYAKWEFDTSTYIDQYLEEIGFIGTALIVVEGEEILHKGYGTASFRIEGDIMNSPEIVYQIGSTTKQFTAACIMILVEQEKLSIGDTLDMYIEDYPNGDQITIHNLLVQNSGIPEYSAIRWDMYEYRYSYNSPESLIDLIKHEPLLHEPGDRFTYSNSNYLLLGYIIEVISEMTYEEFLDQYIFTPLEMTDSGIFTLEKSPKHAIGYSVLSTGSLNAYSARHASLAYAAGAIETTTSDLYKWHQALTQYTLISEENTNKLYEAHVVNDNPDFEGDGDSYGYGWFVFNAEGTVVEHGGGINAFRSGFYRDIENDIVIITLSNINKYKHPEIRDKVIEIFSGIND